MTSSHHKNTEGQVPKNTPTQGLLNVLLWAYKKYCQATFLKPVWQRLIIHIRQEMRSAPTQGLLNLLHWTYQQYCRATFLKNSVWQKCVIRILQELHNTEMSPVEVSRVNELIDGFALVAMSLNNSARKVFPTE